MVEDADSERLGSCRGLHLKLLQYNCNQEEERGKEESLLYSQTTDGGVPIYGHKGHMAKGA